MKKHIIYISVALAFLSVSACTSTQADTETKDEKPFELSARLKQELSLATATLEPIQTQLQLTGKVTPYEDKQVKVSPLVDGVIEKISANLGDFVGKGQTLAIVHSSEVADVENQTVGSTSDLLSAQKNLQVQKDMYKAGLASEKDVTFAQNDLLKAQGSLKRAKEVASIYNVKNAFYTLKAPIAGYVIEKNNAISDKMSFHEGETGAFFTIADLSQIQIVANVYEADIAKVRVGSPVEVKLISYPDMVLKGKIDKMSNALDPETRTLQVRINLANPHFLMKPEMFAQVNVSFSTDTRSIAVPSSSIIFDQNKNFVVVYKDDQHMEVREVQIAKQNANKTYITSGLKEGEKVMNKNQLLVYNALIE
ncbi:efflux RND transporter periplasmic adaptor subunit [Flectobacillus major]|jgi:cobalt-zinc-cadmium efflux system membrane fusion protein|uniref:efflux RND transporter periplasmic adaptor subunit n=1 Tax=Flectobacillus major TaxID=103 RepID=UPI00041ED6B4|nr:efflux RND transporter periplasmic adaptor subunit [Flectobacillus major]